ncbi:MAG: hypothetical protein JO092_11675, partial [Candidatus Eremiobacteraeota bacterium]|nr:hypothetical protein [Candidatus Eremiobacteraeota bacterium]
PEGNALLRVVQGVDWALSFIDPIAYMQFARHLVVSVDGQSFLHYSNSFKLLMLVVLSVFYGVLAVVQWRRVEA